MLSACCSGVHWQKMLQLWSRVLSSSGSDFMGGPNSPSWCSFWRFFLAGLVPAQVTTGLGDSCVEKHVVLLYFLFSIYSCYLLCFLFPLIPLMCFFLFLLWLTMRDSCLSFSFCFFLTYLNFSSLSLIHFSHSPICGFNYCFGALKITEWLTFYLWKRRDLKESTHSISSDSFTCFYGALVWD